MHRLKELRKEKHITQKKLAELINLTDSAVSKYETDRSEIPLDTVNKICAIFNVSIDYFLGISDHRTAYSEANNMVRESMSYNNTLILKTLDDTLSSAAKIINTLTQEFDVIQNVVRSLQDQYITLIYRLHQSGSPKEEISELTGIPLDKIQIIIASKENE